MNPDSNIKSERMRKAYQHINKEKNITRKGKRGPLRKPKKSLKVIDKVGMLKSSHEKDLKT